MVLVGAGAAAARGELALSGGGAAAGLQGCGDVVWCGGDVGRALWSGRSGLLAPAAPTRPVLQGLCPFGPARGSAPGPRRRLRPQTPGLAHPPPDSVGREVGLGEIGGARGGGVSAGVTIKHAERHAERRGSPPAPVQGTPEPTGISRRWFGVFQCRGLPSGGGSGLPVLRVVARRWFGSSSARRSSAEDRRPAVVQGAPYCRASPWGRLTGGAFILVSGQQGSRRHAILTRPRRRRYPACSLCIGLLILTGRALTPVHRADDQRPHVRGMRRRSAVQAVVIVSVTCSGPFTRSEGYEPCVRTAQSPAM